MLKSVYKKEPITGFVIIAGSVDVAIGGIDSNTSLVVFGLSAVGIALALRWWHLQRRSPESSARGAVYALPPASSHAALPPLTVSKKRPTP
ncbi:hypothetical protein ACKFKF_28160 [Phormidesmis sp. 146-12]